MPSSNEIRDVKFSTTMNGYKRDEVDALLDAIEADYVKFEMENTKLRNAVSNLTKELEEAKREQASIQTVLISAQKLADDIVAKAKADAAQIVVESKSKTDLAEQKAKEAIVEIENQAIENRRRAEIEVEQIKKEALATSEAIITSAKDSVARQQIQFEAIKLEVSQFKEQIKAIYKEHVELLSKIPEEVTGTPIEAAQAMEQILAEARRAAAEQAAKDDAQAEVTEQAFDEPSFDEEPEIIKEIETVEETVAEELPVQEEEPSFDQPEEIVEPEPVREENAAGFKITLPIEELSEEEDEEELDDDDDDDDDHRGFGSSFFRRRG